MCSFTINTATLTNSSVFSIFYREQQTSEDAEPRSRSKVQSYVDYSGLIEYIQEHLLQLACFATHKECSLAVAPDHPLLPAVAEVKGSAVAESCAFPSPILTPVAERCQFCGDILE